MSKRSRDSEKCDDGTDFNFNESGFNFNESDDELFVETDDWSSRTLFADENIALSDSDDYLEIQRIDASEILQEPSVVHQHGSGLQLNDAIILEPLHQRENHRYQASERIYRARIDVDKLPSDLIDRPLITAKEAVRDLFRLLMDRTFNNLKPTDLVRFCIQADGLDKPISTTLMPVSEFTLEKLLSVVLKVLQSKDKIKLDSGFLVDVITVRRDVGAGRHLKVINADVDRLRKSSIITIDFDNEGLCCAKAILRAIAHVDQDKKAINTLRDKRRPALLNRARKLHEDAGVSIGPCTYREIAVFENYLDTQIVVFSTTNSNRMSYKSENPRRKRINLWLHDGHYDIITSLKGFYASNFYCKGCEKPYDHEENHYCDTICPICRKTECSPSDNPRRCNDCDRLCRSEECFMYHKAKENLQKFSICDKLYQCPQCSKVILRKTCPRELHRCGTSKCVSCGEFVTDTHLCHLRKIDVKRPSEKIIYFDFETDQSSGEHIVNYAVAQYFNGDERVFKGYSALQEFCSWLFSPTHKQFTAIAHNMKG
ncbi:uncharacterized protein [Parasteatoda tepidariorum]|uniref:uncharacterized protein isoform X2 n=1 Tax=Parasteatoda tepidariorum TaxID=114398 RepID=UPI001C71FF5B|nr:uncharacterized protein LOC107452960 isoform X2 [Parasteatoda tepidariorum]